MPMAKSGLAHQPDLSTSPSTPPPESFYVPYLASPFSIWRPSFPYFEQHINTNVYNPLHSWIWILRAFRVSWVLLIFPLHCLLVTLELLLPSFIFKPFCQLPFVPRVFGSSRSQWTSLQKYLYPSISSFIWALPGTGGVPPTLSPTQLRNIPWISKKLNEWNQSDPVKVQVKQEDVFWQDETEIKFWITGEAEDPEGKVVPITVPCFWLEGVRSTLSGTQEVTVDEKIQGPDGTLNNKDDCTGPNQKWSKAKPGEKIILYFEGGGYVTGSPVSPGRCYNLARETGLKIVGANYRKANAPIQSYPASLQDAITIYHHLCQDLGYESIILAGDSAGAGVAMSLWMYLCTTLQPGPNDQTHKKKLVFPLPTHILLYSPWCDLTLSSYRPGAKPTFNRGKTNSQERTYDDDFLHPTQLNSAVNHYLTNLYSYGYGIDTMALNRLPISASNGNINGYSVEGSTEFEIKHVGSEFTPDQSNKQVQVTGPSNINGNSRVLPKKEIDANSPWKLLATHPFFSPSLPSSQAILNKCSQVYQKEGNQIQFFVAWGSAEIFTIEIENLVSNLRRLENQVGQNGRKVVKVETLEVQDELHVFMTIPQWLSPHAKLVLDKVKDFVKS